MLGVHGASVRSHVEAEVAYSTVLGKHIHISLIQWSILVCEGIALYVLSDILSWD